MKKSQRARLAVLAAKDAATLSAEEKSELATLQGIAATNTDSSQDIDDTTPAAAAPSLTATLKGALSVLGDKARLGTELAQARARVTELEGQLAASTTQVTDLRAQLAARETQFAAIAGFFGLSAKELDGKEASAVHALIAQKISDSATEQLATAGVPAAELPKQTQAGTAAETLDEIQAQMAKTTDAKQLGVLAKKANELRERQWAGQY
jgi:hypothetical protein